jgi:hypothetical protein
MHLTASGGGEENFLVEDHKNNTHQEGGAVEGSKQMALFI